MSGSGSRKSLDPLPPNPGSPAQGTEETQASPDPGGASAPEGEASAPGDGHATRGEAPEPACQDAGQQAGAPQAAGSPQDEHAAGDGAAVTGESPQADKPRPGTARRPVRRRRSFWRELPVLVVVALVLALIIKTYVIQAFYIPSGSMENTLDIGDRVLINKLVYHFRGIARGDIVVFNGNGSWDFTKPAASPNFFTRAVDDVESVVGISHDSDIYIKRVIGLPGDHVACCNARGQVTVNGVALSESSYIYPGNAPSIQRFNITVPPGRLWVMGDHRFDSYDSRGHMGDPGGGTIPESAVLGRAFVRIWPPSRWGFLNIPATFGQPKLTASAAAAGRSGKALAATDAGVALQAAGPVLPLGLGLAGALPLTMLQRVGRRRLSAARRARRARRT